MFKKNPDQTTIMQLDPNGKKLNELVMFSNVYFICMEYRLQVHKQACYLFQYPSKVVTETADAVSKSKFPLPKTMTRRFFWLLQMIRKYERCRKNYTRVSSKADYSPSNTSMEDFTPGLNSAIYIIREI